jgi:hypothetical protein
VFYVTVQFALSEQFFGEASTIVDAMHDDSRIPSENRDLINRADREHPVKYRMLR